MVKSGRPTTKQSFNPLATIGAPIFSLLIYLLTAIFFFLQATLNILKKLTHLHPSTVLSTLDNYLTNALSKSYLKRPTKTRPSHQPKRIFPSIVGPSFPSFSLISIILVIIIVSIYIYQEIFAGLPSPYDLTRRSQKLTTQILARNGETLYKIYQDENRTPIKLTSLPPYVKEAFLAVEDNGFYHHTGFSITAVLRATYHNLSRQKTEGGSTITQQLVKNALLTSEKTWQRKIKELVLAIAVESVYDKDQILEMYLNEVGFGGPAYGIQEAAQQYFNVDAASLDLAQAAFLAGLPKAPSKYSPYIHPVLALSRQSLVLNLMFKAGYINQDQLDQAIQTPLQFAPTKIEIRAPHFVMYVRDLLVDQFGEELVSHGGLKVVTTLDPALQLQAEQILNQELNHLTGLNVSNGAVLITRPNSGEILTMVGSKNYFDLENNGQVNLTTSLRQPGSTIKVVNYALAFENGAKPSDTIKDEPISFNIPGSGIWTPKNYDGRFHGNVTLRNALANSYNIPAVLLLARNGVKNMIALGEKMGITTWTTPSRYGLSLTLGGAEVKMTDMAVVYGTLANGGTMTPLNPILRIEDNQGKPLNYDHCLIDDNCLARAVLKPETAFFINDILSDNSARSAAFGYHSVLNLSPFTAAVKTGTSNDLRDNWTFGYTPNHLVATWVGNNDNSPMSRVTSGITGASPIWSSLMKHILVASPDNTSFIPPGNLVKLPICTLTGTLTCSGCPTRYEYFTLENAPKQACNPDDVAKIIEERSKATPTPARSGAKIPSITEGQILSGATTSR